MNYIEVMKNITTFKQLRTFDLELDHCKAYLMVCELLLPCFLHVSRVLGFVLFWHCS